ncbi:tetratricopeptide repeat protein [Flammeovirga agarivorans]|uniref:Tetratricopeptide repeat protein n=1 Tax=Flammeovirga agarivorans TaxID=2726742 RepID=A0A7X8SMK4_9BACT|nr:tetratricopeptide repeat protein [Flammeovirga agarivorans]NLR92922.1 hypothetical protein [Flammeovirga agarivorans]
MQRYVFFLFTIFLTISGCQEEDDSLDGLVDASSHEGEFYEKQVKFLNKAIRSDKRNPRLYYLKGNVEISLHAYASALENAEHAIKLDSIEGRYYFLEGQAHYYLNNFRRALSSGTKAIKLKYKNPSLNILMADAYNNLGKADSALLFIEESEKATPNSIPLQKAKAKSFELKGDKMSAMALYKKILSVKPTDTVAYAQLIHYEVEQKNEEGAKLLITQANENEVSSLDIQLYQGQLIMGESYFDSAEVIFENILTVNPSKWEASRQLGKLKRKKNLPLEAKKVLLEGLKHTPNAKQLWYELGLTEQYMLRDYGEARKDYEKALEIDPAYLDARRALNNLRAYLRKLYAPPVTTTEEQTEDTGENTSSEE